MSAEIQASTGILPELIAGGGGVFDVRADDRLLFSKQQRQRFPEEGEVAAALGPTDLIQRSSAFDSGEGRHE